MWSSYVWAMENRSLFRNQQIASHTKIIDLGNDFRLTEDKDFNGKPFVYGFY
jgi:N-acetyl-gamma-glutamyl-phosphate reductase